VVVLSQLPCSPNAFLLTSNPANPGIPKPAGAPLKTPVMCSRVDINLRHVHQLLLSAPGVSGATVMYRELKAGVSLVAFVTPPTVSTDALQKELRLKLHAYQARRGLSP
jgi:hypothetical protein